MSAILINLPKPVTRVSSNAAKTMGISINEFVTRAVLREARDFELKMIIKSFNAMKQSKQYLVEAEELEQFYTDLPIEDNTWWRKKKH